MPGAGGRALKMPFSFTNNLFCCTTPNHVALVGEKKTSEARGERGEEQRIIEAGFLIIDRSISSIVNCGESVGVALRKPEEKKRNLTEPSLFTFGRRGGVGPMGASRLQFNGADQVGRKLIH